MIILLGGAIVLIMIAIYFLVQPSPPSEKTGEVQEIQPASVKSSLNVQIGVGFLALLGIAAFFLYNPLPGRWTAVFPSDAAKNNTKVIRQLQLTFGPNKQMTYSVKWSAEGGGIEAAPGGQTVFHSDKSSGEISFKGSYSVSMFRVYVNLPVAEVSQDVEYPPFTLDKIEKDLTGKLTMKLWAPIRLAGEQLIIEGGSPVKEIHFAKSDAGADNPFVLEFKEGGLRGRAIMRNTKESVKSVSYEYMGPERKSDIPQTNIISNKGNYERY